MYEGKGVEKNIEQSLEWLNKIDGDVTSEVALKMGKIYLLGIDTEKNLDKAKKYLEQAVHADYSEAIFLLGKLNEETNQDDYLELYQKAADRGFAEAQEALASYYLKQSD
ncbi:MAG: hypothetical protein M1445_06235, partial [Bacteroidetes bacterium]|nr:hypothetical protein [Bacteroidota bacterium]